MKEAIKHKISKGSHQPHRDSIDGATWNLKSVFSSARVTAHFKIVQSPEIRHRYQRAQRRATREIMNKNSAWEQRRQSHYLIKINDRGAHHSQRHDGGLADPYSIRDRLGKTCS